MSSPKPVGAVVPDAVKSAFENIAVHDLEVEAAAGEAVEAARVASEKAEANIKARQELAASVRAFAVAVKEQASNSALGEAEYLQIIHSVFHPEG
jgi:hypothetical protein